MTRLALEPLASWPYIDATPVRTPFKSTWSSTRDLLAYETEQLGAHLVVVELDIEPSQLRRDGELRASARAKSGRVRVSFDSIHGQLSYSCDRYYAAWRGPGPEDWKENVRAVALGLEALRKVDRYGITRGSEQYAGFRALPSGNGADASHMTREQACVVLGSAAGWESPPDWADPMVVRLAFKAARAATHPDRHSGDRTLWDEVERAAVALGLGGAA